MQSGPNKLVPKTEFMLKQDEEKKRRQQTTTPPPFQCSDLKLGQYMASGEPKARLITGFPKSGAMWVKSLLDAILPYYVQMTEIKENIEIPEEEHDVTMPGKLFCVILEPSGLLGGRQMTPIFGKIKKKVPKCCMK